MGNAISSEGDRHHPLLAEDDPSPKQLGERCTNVSVQSVESRIKESQAIHQGDRGLCHPTLTQAKGSAKEADPSIPGLKDEIPEWPHERKTPDDKDTITANLIANWPNDIPTPKYSESDAAIGVIQPDIPPGYWAKLARKCVWRWRAVKRPGTLLFILAALPLCREPVLKQGHGGQTAGIQNGLEFSNSVAVKKENVEALLAHVVGQLATDPCIHCRVGDGRFAACVIVAGVHGAMPACTNCHWGGQGFRCSFALGDEDSDEDPEAFKKRWLAKIQGKLEKAQGYKKQRAKAKTLRKKVRALQQSMKLQSGEV